MELENAVLSGKSEVVALIALAGLSEETGSHTVYPSRKQRILAGSPSFEVSNGSEENNDSNEAENEYSYSSEETTDEEKETKFTIDPSELKYATSRELRKRKDDEDWKPSSTKKTKRPRTGTMGSSDDEAPSTRKKSRSSGNKLEKLSFQEAAIRVMIDQQKKGVFALTTRQIWDLIQQSGLVDTKCKTPVSSLSSRITEDVRTKGNKSIFLRVGEGLYSLRQGLSQEQLEHFLSTQQPLSPPTRNIKRDKSYDSSEDEELPTSSYRIKLNGTIPDMTSVNSKRMPKESSPILTSPLSTEPTWSGLPFKIKSHSVSYAAVAIGSVLYRIGDYAYFCPNSENERPYVGKILKFWQNNYPKSKSVTERMFVKCAWYYYPEETYTGKTKKHHKNELFLSDLEDVNNVTSILGSLKVVSYPEFTKLSQMKVDLKNIYFTRASYINETFLPLHSESSNGAIEIDLAAADIDAPSSSWPTKELMYSNSLIPVEAPEQYKDTDYDGTPKYELVVEIPTPESSDQQTKYRVDASVAIHSGQILGEYGGFLRVLQKSNPSSTELLESSFTMVLLEDENAYTVVDASTCGNELRYIKDSQGSLTPNVTLLPFRKAGNKPWHLFVISTADIKKGERLVADFSNVRPERKSREKI